MTDPYPSRTGEAVQILPRKDPVVWRSMSRPWPGPLTEPELRSFGETGLLVVENLFDSRELDGLCRAAERTLEERRGSGDPEVIEEPAAECVGSIFGVHENVYNKLSAEARLVDRACQLLDGPVYIHQSRLNYQPAIYGREFHWHSDFETWHVEDGMPRMRAVSCAIALTGDYNGFLLLIPASHLEFVPCAGTAEQDFGESLMRQYCVPDSSTVERLVDRGGIYTFKGEPGSTLFFDCNMMHRSSSNPSPLPRTHLFFAYNSVENPLGDPFSGLEPRPGYIASREVNPLSGSVRR